MTTLHKEEVRCDVCGGQSECIRIVSTNALGPPDLDMRPREMERSTMRHWVHRCPHCGYCASELSESPTGADAVVEKTEYKDQLKNPDYPELANSFLCKAMVDRATGDLVEATWALIRAAWACDDSGSPEKASACRQQAAQMLEMAQADGQDVAEQEGVSDAVLVDLLRRSGQMERAERVIESHRDVISEETIHRIFEYQSLLIREGDTSCHTVAEALGEEE
ncbi:MAG: hypothetical protein KAX19_10055 [Candidatus Brocadiae bacterium]|nr:hypothetical protein [Candidatus Brocadiia bacterium]